MKAQPSRRITLVTNEIRGFTPVGGLGTATTFLALALARLGHRVEILYFGRHSVASMDRYWTDFYERAGVRVRCAPQGEKRVEPFHFRRMRSVEVALRTDPPDAVIVQDLGAPAYAALRLRHLGLAFEDTLFVVLCHGTRRWVTDMSRQVGAKSVRDLLSVSVLEQASLELADVVVSPSAYLIEWMREQGWRLPDRTLAIPYLTRSAATGEPPPKVAAPADDGGRVRRLAFFGRLEEKKGVEVFVTALNALDPRRLEGLELEFVGKPTPTWTADRVRALLAEPARQSLGRISFESDLDQREAFARLRQPETLTVIPSLGDNSPNTVYECLELGIPFIASRAGGIPELVAPEDRARVLFEPTAEGLEDALRRVLSEPDAWQPARPAFDAATSLERWAGILATPARKPVTRAAQSPVDVVVVARESGHALSRCLAALKRQRYEEFRVVLALAGPAVEPPAGLDGVSGFVRSEQASVEAAREAGLRAAVSPWIVFLDEGDVPADEFLETLVRAQAASGADVVSCALHLAGEGTERTEHFFAGEPGALGLLANDYGTVALLRRSLLDDLTGASPAADPDWPLLAHLSAAGASIVSVPTPLVARASPPGTLQQHPADALLVAEQFERALPDELRVLARLAAGLAADARPAAVPTGTLPRALHIVRAEGGLALGRRVLRRLPWRRR